MQAGMTARFLNDERDLDVALASLMQADARLRHLIEVAGRPALRRRPAGFAGLCAIICSQQLSTASAAAIWGRLAAAFDPLDPGAVGRARADKLARIGLSRPKIKTLKAISRAVKKGELDIDRLVHMDADTAHAALIALHGIGAWTADIYLLFCLGHADAWPAGDLALQKAARLAFGLKQRPAQMELIKLAERWRPWRGVAAHVLWNYYRAVKKRDAIPLQPPGTKHG
jgi:DNA-3-methyladenine glycosylase II